ncbi:MAG: substrate-binding domain-containing protein [Spirochaetales bacterium]|nr:substrate-binding domain-containing protein [Spirochaetales bacterium]
MNPNITSIDQPLEKLCQQAVRTLDALICGETVPSVSHVPTELVIRRSCGCRQPFSGIARNSARKRDSSNIQPEKFFEPDFSSLKEAVLLRSVNVLTNTGLEALFDHVLRGFLSALGKGDPSTLISFFEKHSG